MRSNDWQVYTHATHCMMVVCVLRLCSYEAWYGLQRRLADLATGKVV